MRIDDDDEPDALDYLRSIYNDAQAQPHLRFEAARAALPFERPKLNATQLIEGGGDIAARLKVARLRVSPMLIEYQPIENDEE